MEEAEGLESGSTGADAAGASGVDPVAVALALGGASRAEADAFLSEQRTLATDQRALIADQRHHLHEQFKHLHLSVWEKRLGVFLRLATAAVGVAIASAIGLAVWNASQADGTVVDTFSVPPQFVQAGITGEAVADDLTSRIGAIREVAQNNSVSASQNVRKDSADDIKVEIPETGVSLGQAWRYLRLWLGHERHLSGSVRLIGEGKMTLTVAVNGERAATVSGGSGDLDNLEQQAAEQVFASVDPTNLVIYLLASQRPTESLAAAERYVETAGPEDRANAFSLWADTTRLGTGDMPLAFARASRAVAANPKFIAGHREMMLAAVLMGHDEDALSQARLIANLQDQDQQKAMRGRGFAQFAAEGANERDAALGAFVDGMSRDDCLSCTSSSGNRAEFAARAHDGSAGRTLASGIAPEQFESAMRTNLDAKVARTRYFSEVNVQDWPAAAASARSYERILSTDATRNFGTTAVRLLTYPLLADALARGGDIAGAQAVIDATPGDCYHCVRTRGLVAAAAKQWGRADYWFARAVAQAPSLPFAYADWGQALLARGQPDAAIAKLIVASQKGPHFADPLEGWGEALMAQNRSDLALAKFAEADKYAPNWGRLHLKWGEALGYAGKPDEAKKQFALAAGLDLTPSEKSELLRRR